MTLLHHLIRRTVDVFVLPTEDEELLNFGSLISRREIEFTARHWPLLVVMAISVLGQASVSNQSV